LCAQRKSFRYLQNISVDGFHVWSRVRKVDKAVFEGIPKSRGLDGLAAGLMYAGLHDAGPQVWRDAAIGCIPARNCEWTATTRKTSWPRKSVPLAGEGHGGSHVLLVIFRFRQGRTGRRPIVRLPANQSRFRAELWAQATNPSQPTTRFEKSMARPGYWQIDTHWIARGTFRAEASPKSSMRSLEPEQKASD